MTIRRLRGWALPALLLCGLTSCNASPETQAASSRQDTSIVRVKVARAKEKGMERHTTRPASVHSFDYASLFAKVTGYLQEQRVDIGNHVKKGDLLAQIYVPELWTDVDRTKAGLKKAEADVRVKAAQVKAAKANLEESRIEVSQAEADWKAAQATLEFRKEEYTRFNKLVKAKAIEAELLDEKREQRKAAESKEFAARKKIKTMEARVLSFEAALTQAEAERDDAQANVGVAKAALQHAEVLAKYTKITAPFTGVVTERFFHDGDFIRDAARGSGKNDPLFRVARTDLMRVVMYVPDRDVPFVKQGQTAELFVDALQGQKFTGKVARMAYSEQYETRTMRAEVDIPNPQGVLRDGMFGTMTIQLGRYKGVTVPSPSLTDSQTKGKRALFVVRDNRAKKVDVEVLADDGIEASVRGDDLKAGDQIVAEHSSGLSDGTRVQPQESKDAGKKEKKK